MCFSATASFSAAAFCGGIGALTVQRAKRPDLMLAFIPVIFALHQALEGFVWLTGAAGYGRCAGYSFATIAFCLWPLYVPLAAWQSETSPRRRTFMLAFLALGVLITAAAVSVLHSGLTIDFATHHIRYIPGRRYPLIFDYLYAIAVAGPLLLHGNKHIKIFGCLILAFLAVSTLIFNPARYSVWCFFAAGSSVVLYFFVRSRNAPQPERPPASEGIASGLKP